MAIILTLASIFGLLVINELWWRGRRVHGELSRKFIHVTVGSFVAFWPFYLSWTDIKFLGLAFLIVVATSQYLKLFQAIHSVQRATWGELCFSLSVGVLPFITQNKWIYMTALLQMALADGLAAIVGVRFGNGQSYVVFDHTKSVVGTLTFFIVSVLVLSGYTHFSHHHLAVAWIVIISALTSALENIAVFGLDNLAVPLIIALLLVHH